MRRFTLIEMIITIIILSVLASIVTIRILDLKKTSITNTMLANTSIMQSVVDEYYLKNNIYPIKDREDLTLETPQLIDYEELLKGGYVKKELDTKKIKEQHYWVDVFGKVWATTSKDIRSINVFTKDETNYLEFIVGEKITGYKIYEVQGYNEFANDLNKADLYADTNIQNSKKYKVVKEAIIEGSGEKIERFEIPKNNANYLVSAIDEYGLETAPFGQVDGGIFSPLLNKTGVYEFEIDSKELMFWQSFKYLAYTPGESTVTFSFKVRDENGEYKDWEEDFYQLAPSTGIVIKVDLKGDKDGNKPSLYDLRIHYKFKDDEVIVRGKPEKEDETAPTCPKAPFSTTVSSNTKESKKGQMVYSFYMNEGESLFSKTPFPEFRYDISFEILSKKLYISEDGESYSLYNDQPNVSEKCFVVVYEVQTIELPADCEERGSCKEQVKVCGSNGTKSNYYGSNKVVVYKYVLGDNESISTLTINKSFKGLEIESVSLEYSIDGKPYVSVRGTEDIPAGSCVNVIYKFLSEECLDCDYPPIPPEPTVEKCKGNDCPKPCGKDCIVVDSCEDCDDVDRCLVIDCDGGKDDCMRYEGKCIDPVCIDDCSPHPPLNPDPKDKELNDLEWTTVDRLKFYSFGPNNKLTRWYDVEHEQDIFDKENTRIIYRYSKSSGYYWSREYEDFSKTNIARNILGIAYIQVKTKKVNDIPEDKLPLVTKMKFYNEEGFVDLSMVQPTLIVSAVKDNNKETEFFSDKSNIEWIYDAADPRNRKIVDIEWDGDIRSNYPVGTYEIKARVKNETGYWSEWFTYHLEVLAEKPIAVISLNKDRSGKTAKYKWDLTKSIDPDKDGIVDFEWINKKDSYPIGNHLVKARVKDLEGYWSDWTEYNLKVGEEGYNVYRLEAESSDNQVTINGGITTTSSSYSNGKALAFHSGSYYVEFEFEGTGFDISVSNSVYIKIDNDGPISLGKGLIEIRDLENKKHKVVVSGINSSATMIDYLDVYSPNDKVIMTEVRNRVLTGTTESSVDSNVFATNLNQSVKFYYQLDKNGMEDLSVVNSKGDKVKTISSKNVQGGTYRDKVVIWDGRDDAGEVVSNGTYRLVMNYKGVNGTKSSYEVEFKVLNETKLYRIEAEAINDPQVSQVGGTTTTSSSYSGGKTLVFRSKSSYVTFKFKGTGFDIFGTNTLELSIDSEPKFATAKGLVSIRDLEDKEHTVIVSIPSTTATFIDYLDVYGSNDKVEISNIITKGLHNGIETENQTNTLSNVLNQSLIYYYETDKDGLEEITVVNNKGETIRNISSKNIAGGTYRSKSVIWDGKDNEGSSVSSGIYKLTLNYKGVYGTESTYSIETEVDNKTPSYRLEAETANTQVTLSGVKTTTSGSFSGGKVAAFSSKTHSVTFKFKGTGFDVFTTGKMEVTIDSGEVITTQKGLVSFRNLENNEHTVVVKAPSTSSVFLDYLDVYE